MLFRCFVEYSCKTQHLFIRRECRLLEDGADLILSLFVELRKGQLSDRAQCRAHGPKLSAVIWSSIWRIQQHQSQPECRWWPPVRAVLQVVSEPPGVSAASCTAPADRRRHSALSQMQRYVRGRCSARGACAHPHRHHRLPLPVQRMR